MTNRSPDARGGRSVTFEATVGTDNDKILKGDIVAHNGTEGEVLLVKEYGVSFAYGDSYIAQDNGREYQPAALIPRGQKVTVIGLRPDPRA